VKCWSMLFRRPWLEGVRSESIGVGLGQLFPAIQRLVGDFQMVNAIAKLFRNACRNTSDHQQEPSQQCAVVLPLQGSLCLRIISSSLSSSLSTIPYHQPPHSRSNTRFVSSQPRPFPTLANCLFTARYNKRSRCRSLLIRVALVRWNLHMFIQCQTTDDVYKPTRFPSVPSYLDVSNLCSLPVSAPP